MKTFPHFVKNNEGNAVNLNSFIKIGCTIACKINKNGLTSNVSFNWNFMVNINFLDFCDSPFLDIFFFDFSFFLRVKFVNPTNAPRASVRCVHVLGKCVDHIITLYQIHLREGPISLLLSHHLFINNLTSNIFCASCIFLLVIVKTELPILLPL